MECFGLAAGVGTKKLFDYNRENFRYDREQRQKNEYKIADMRITQSSLWREDIRDIMGLTTTKMEAYLIVAALELGFCMTALCKGRVPPGAPPWLLAAHTLALMGAFVYLFLAIWLGMHAFVAAQAYKVRILTQLVRLPVPTWQTLEASSTYSSSFERNRASQMVRVPFLMGRQEQRVQGSEYPGDDSPARAPGDEGPSDPWGLERRGNDIIELAPDVNEQTVNQRHIWLAREAALFYQTYDAFCRICLSAGTASIATFFCYFCLTYVLTENAAPAAAWAGMLCFVALSLVIVKLDLLIPTHHFAIGAVLMLTGPVICAAVAFVSSKNKGNPENWEYLMPIALLAHGTWLLYYIWLLRVVDTENGTVLPMAFRTVLYTDVFGWAKHGTNWWRRMMRRSSTARQMRLFTSAGTSKPDRASGSLLPTMECVDPQAPRRPEDVSTDFGKPKRPGERRNPEGSEPRRHVSFRPNSFAGNVQEDTENQGIHSGSDLLGEKPGLAPWRVFFISTICIAILYYVASIVALRNAINGTALFVNPNYVDLKDGEIAPLADLQLGTEIKTNWPSALARPQGLACDPEGVSFVTSGRAADGHKTILHARLKASRDDGLSLLFEPAPTCHALNALNRDDAVPLQDLALHDCQNALGCKTLVLPRHGEHLVSCPLHQSSDEMPHPTNTSTMGGGAEVALIEQATESSRSMPVGRAWLDDRGSALLNDVEHRHRHVFPEEISSVVSVPCDSANGAASDCIVMGTTGRRLVQMKVGAATENNPSWMPKRMVRRDHVEVPVAGSLALLGMQYLGVLHQNQSTVHAFDLKQGGAHIGSWRLPPAPTSNWASVCAGGNSIYALAGGEDPSLWRFEAPSQLRS